MPHATCHMHLLVHFWLWSLASQPALWAVKFALHTSAMASPIVYSLIATLCVCACVCVLALAWLPFADVARAATAAMICCRCRCCLAFCLFSLFFTAFIPFPLSLSHAPTPPSLLAIFSQGAALPHSASFRRRGAVGFGFRFRFHLHAPVTASSCPQSHLPPFSLLNLAQQPIPERTLFPSPSSHSQQRRLVYQK